MKNNVTLHLRLSRGTVALISLTVFLVLGTAVTAVFAQSDQTINGCKNNKKGTLRIVSKPGACESKETAISWNKTGPAGPQGEQGLQGDKGDTGPAGPPGPAGSGFKVIDAEQREVGIAVGDGGVARSSGPYWLWFYVDQLGIPGAANHPLYNDSSTYLTLYYETADCSGTPYMQAGGVYRAGQASGTKIYYPADPVQVRTFHSVQDATLPGSTEECYPNSSGRSIVSGPVESFDIPDFTPPFTTVRDAP